MQHSSCLCWNLWGGWGIVCPFLTRTQSVNSVQASFCRSSCSRRSSSLVLMEDEGRRSNPSDCALAYHLFIHLTQPVIYKFHVWTLSELCSCPGYASVSALPHDASLHLLKPLLTLLVWLVWPDAIVFRITANVTTPQIESRCACGTRTMTSSREWSSTSSASRMTSWARPSSRSARWAEKWMSGTI